jgi:hypothetical protein
MVKGQTRQKKVHEEARCWWLTPVIPATWEAEIRRIEVQDQPRKIAQESPSPKPSEKHGPECGSRGKAPVLQI